jgi:hypothetical protein
MFGLTSLAPRRDPARRTPVRSRRPTLEGLENRYLLSSLEGGQWTYGSRITYSFMPDGTSIGGVPSSLFKTMNTYYSTAAWQQAVEAAAAIWEQVANINLVQVSDNGEPDGAPGLQQGDPNVGDIRIGALPMGSGQLAFTLVPPPVNGGTDAGDMFFNSTQTWGSKGYDLETVALHEFGHALGLGESSVMQAVMYTYYTGVKTTLNADDIGAIQSLYGAVPPNLTNNVNAATAINLTSSIGGNGQIALSGVSIANSSDNEWYVVTVPSTTTGTMIVTMQSSNLSSLCPRLAVFNGQVQGLGQAIAPNTYGATVSYTVNNVSPGQVYYIRASAANTGPGSDGAFGLLVNFGSQPQAPIPPPNTVVPSQPDQGGGTANLLTTGLPGVSSNAIGPTGSNWWSNWIASWQNGTGTSGPGFLRIGSSTAWGAGLSVGTTANVTATANLVTGGSGPLAGSPASSFLTIIAPLITGVSGNLLEALDSPGASSSNVFLTTLDLILANWISGQQNPGNGNGTSNSNGNGGGGGIVAA